MPCLQRLESLLCWPLHTPYAWTFEIVVLISWRMCRRWWFPCLVKVDGNLPLHTVSWQRSLACLFVEIVNCATNLKLGAMLRIIILSKLVIIGGNHECRDVAKVWFDVLWVSVCVCVCVCPCVCACVRACAQVSRLTLFIAINQQSYPHSAIQPIVTILLLIRLPSIHPVMLVWLYPTIIWTEWFTVLASIKPYFMITLPFPNFVNTCGQTSWPLSLPISLVFT